MPRVNAETGNGEDHVMQSTSCLRSGPRHALVAGFLGLAVGAVITAAWVTVSEKADLMDGSSRIGRMTRLMDVTTHVGPGHLRSCRSKVASLHAEIARREAEETSEIAGKLVASILIDGEDCNPYLLAHLDSRRQLPRIPFFREFRLTDLSGENLSVPLRDEQGLMLWMLSRINPDRLLPSIEYYSGCEQTEEELRTLLTDHWRVALE